MIGQKIGNIQIIELIGEGGMGTVYRAKDIQLEREVAVKVLHEHLCRDEVLLSRFKNEALLSARINHPHVATLYQFLESDGRDFLVMEYVHGQNLEKILKQKHRLAIRTTAQILLQLAEGLQNAHNKGIIHRDIKPSNIMINDEGYVKLMDFGIARLEESARMTKMHHVIGTTQYLAPELLQGVAPSVASDLYAVGMVGYEMLYGNVPFQSNSDAALVHEIMQKTPSYGLVNATPETLKLIRILKKLLQKNPAKRYESTAVLINELESIARHGRISWEEEARGTTLAGTWTGKTSALVKKYLKILIPLDLASRWKTLEGKIILSSLVLALLLVFVRLAQPKKPVLAENEIPEQMQNPTWDDQVDLSTIVRQEEPAETKRESDKQPEELNTQPIEPADDENPPPKKPEKKPPLNARETQEEKNPPQNSRQITKPPQEVTPSTPVITEPEIISSPPEEKPNTPEEKPEPKAKFKTIAVQIPSVELNGSFSQTVTSDKNQKNDVFYLRNQTPVYASGHLVIASGARIQAVVKDARSSHDRAKAFLAVQFLQVETVDGNWVPIQYPTYSNNGYEEIKFREGTTVQKLKLKSRSIQLKIQD